GTPVAVFGGRVRCLPFKRGGAPGVGAGRLACAHAPEHIDEEQYLCQCNEDCCQRDVLIQCLGGGRNEIGASHRVIATWYAQETEIMHRQIDGIGSEECAPEVQLAQPFMHHATGHLRIPVVERGVHYQNRRDAHDHVEVGYHEIGIGQRQVDHHIAQEQTGQPSVNEGERSEEHTSEL